MTGAIDFAQQSETAADYARSQNCFYPHKDAPFCFHGQIKHLQETILQRGDDLIEIPNLVTEPLPPIHINLDFIEEPELDSRSPDSLILEPVDSISVALADNLDTFRQLQSPLEPLDLGCDLKKEVRQYLNSISSKSSCNVLYQWFPLSPVDTDKDAGLLFPSATSRWQQLASRELDREKIEVSDEAEKLLQDLDHLQVTCNNWTLEKEDLGLHQLKRVRIYPVSPLMSPPSSSDIDEPFIPSPRVTIIDLTSEPSSPPNPAVRKLQQDVQNGTLDSEPIVPSAASSSPLHDSVQYLMPPPLKSSDLKVDVPLVLSSSDESTGWDSAFRTTDLIKDKPVESESDPNEPAGFFDDAMEAILKSCHDHTAQNVESEQLNATHSLLRMDIPSLRFEVPNSEWHNHLASSEAQFRWMKVTLGLSFSLKPAAISARLCADLKWSPIPHSSGRVSLKELLDLPGPESRQYLAIGTPRICSDDYTTCPKELSILHTSYDEDIEADTPSEGDETYAEQEEAMPNGPGPSVLNEKVPPVHNLRSRHFRVSPRMKRKVADGSGGILPLSGDTSTTAKFLSNFLELQCKKKPKTSNETCQNRNPRNKMTPAHVISTHSSPQLACTNVNLSDAPAPDVVIPSKPYRLIVSTSLDRAIMSHIEKEWPQLELVDKDFSQYKERARSLNSALPKGPASLLLESDISVSPRTGIILTSLLKVKQKPLPGSNLVTPLYQRVRHVSEKYESLFILVSTANPMGEYVSDLSESDKAAYSNFVQFTTSLELNITVELVHGAEKTLCRWALSVIVSSAELVSNFGNVVTSKDTSWGLFLRGAGMNIFASQVLEMLLVAQYGDSGMDQFLAMSPDERVSKYGKALGGNRVLMHVSSAISGKFI